MARILFKSVSLALCALMVVGGGGGHADVEQGLHSAQSPAAIEDIDAFLDQCPSDAELEILREDFPIYTEGQSEIAEERPYRCSEPVSEMATEAMSERLNIYQALRLIRHMKLESRLPWTDLLPYEWLKSKIGGISLRDDLHAPFCCTRPEENPQVQTIVFPTRDKALLKSKTYFIYPRNGVGVVDEVLLIFHEARHIDKPHNCDTCASASACATGTGCDTDLEYMGAWGVQNRLNHMMADGEIEIGLDAADRQDYYRSELEYRAERIVERRLCETTSSGTVTTQFYGGNPALVR